MRSPHLLLLAMLLPGAACVRTAVPPERQPSLPIPEAWDSATETEGPVDIHWWKQFQDPQLDVLIEETLRNNFQLRAIAVRLETALVEAQIAGAGGIPSVGFSLNGRRQRMNFIGFPIPGFEGRVPRATFTNLGASLDINWEADLWGRISNGEIQAGALASAHAADLAAARHSLAGQTAKAWFACSEATLQLALAREMVGSFKATSKWLRNRYEAGFAPALEISLVESDISAAESAVHLRRELLDRGIRQVELLAGRYPYGALQVRESLPEVAAAVPAGVPSQLLTRRPDLIAAQRRLLASDAGVAQAQTALHPRLSLTTASGTATKGLLSLLNGDYAVWSLLGNLVQPIFQGGRLRRQVDIAEGRSQEILETYAGAVLQAFGEVETALSVEVFLRDRMRELEESVAEAETAREQARFRYRRGLGDLLVVMQTDRRILNSKSQILTLQRLLLENRIDLHLALGGGFDPGAAPGAPGALLPVTLAGENGN